MVAANRLRNAFAIIDTHRYFNYCVNAALLCCLVATNSSYAQTIESDLSDFSCASLLISSGTERDLSFAFLHGYLHGEMQQTILKPDDLAFASDSLIEQCLASVDESALTLLRKIYSKSDVDSVKKKR